MSPGRIARSDAGWAFATAEVVRRSVAVPFEPTLIERYSATTARYLPRMLEELEGVAEGAGVDPFGAALLARPGIEDVELRDGDLRFSTDDQTVAGLTVALGQASIALTVLMPETASLEELFLGMTDGESSDHDGRRQLPMTAEG